LNINDEEVSKLTVAQQIAYYRKMAEDRSMTGAPRLTAFEKLTQLIGEQSENNARYIIEVKPYVEPELTTKTKPMLKRKKV